MIGIKAISGLLAGLCRRDKSPSCYEDKGNGDYILKVMKSCKGPIQANNALDWGLQILRRYEANYVNKEYIRRVKQAYRDKLR